MKLITKLLILAEVLDLFTTGIGKIFIPAVWESNPIVMILGGWIPAILIKMLATLVIVLVFEFYEKQKRPIVKFRKMTISDGKLPQKLIWLIPSVAFLAVVVNILTIWFELIS